VRWVVISIFMIGSLGMAGSLHAQYITYERSALYTGSFSAVDIINDTAYCVGNRSLAIFSIANPDSPVYLGGVTFSSYANDIKVSGHYAYVALGSLYGVTGLEIIEIGDAADPIIVGEYDRASINTKIFIRGNYLYLTDSIFGFQILDISEPPSPRSVSQFDTPGEAMGIFVSDTLAYVADFSGGLQIVNIGDPVNPSFMGNYSTRYGALDVFADHNLAYIGEGFADITPGYLEIVNIIDPTQPVFVGIFDTLGYCQNITVVDSIAFLTVGEEFGADFLAVNVKDPVNPICMGGIHGGYYGFSLAGHLAVMSGWYPSLQILDIADPSSPRSRGSYYRPGEITGVCASGDYAYAAAGPNGLWIASASGNDDALSYLDLRGITDDLCISGNYCFMANMEDGLQIIDIGNALEPEYIGGYDSLRPVAVAVRDNLAYLADIDDSIDILDVSDPRSPSLLGSCSVPGGLCDIALQGDYAYLAAYQGGGLQVVNISDPNNPLVVGGHDTPGYAKRVFVDGNCAYIADYFYGLQIFDISDPTAPEIVGNYRTTDYVVDVAVADNMAFILYTTCIEGESYCIGGVQMLNVTDSSNPILIEDYPTQGKPQAIFIDGGRIFVADYYSLLVLRYSMDGIEADDYLPDSYTLLQNYPNPFNSRTTISYDLPRTSLVTIDIYDMLGRKMTTLLSSSQQAGTHSVVWDAREVSSGIYFYKLKANEFSEIKRMILLK
jgi:hypothetical protein